MDVVNVFSSNFVNFQSSIFAVSCILLGFKYYVKMEASRSTLQESPTRGNPDRMSVQKFANYHDEYDPFSENEQRLKSSYDVMKESTNQDVDTMNPEARVLHYTACINNVSKDIKLGGLVGIHEMLRTEELSNEIVEVILGEVLTAIEHWEE